MEIETIVLEQDRHENSWSDDIVKAGETLHFIKDVESGKYFHFGYTDLEFAKAAAANLEVAYQDRAEYERDMHNSNWCLQHMVDITRETYEQLKARKKL